jgi:tetratricopeptide (TPR) repeat protein
MPYIIKKVSGNLHTMVLNKEERRSRSREISKEISLKAAAAENEQDFLLALRLHQKAVDVCPRFALALINQGNLLLFLKRSEEAEICFLRAIKMDRQSSAIAHLKLAEIIDEKEGPGKGHQYILDALEIFPDNADVHLALAWSYDRRHQHGKALEEYRKYLNRPDVDNIPKIEVIRERIRELARLWRFSIVPGKISNGRHKKPYR